MTMPANDIATKADYFWASQKTIPDYGKSEKYKNRGLKSFCRKDYLGSKELINIIKDFLITERTLLKSRFQQCTDALEVRDQCAK